MFGSSIEIVDLTVTVASWIGVFLRRVPESPVVLNTLARVSAYQFWIVTDDHTEHIVEAPRVMRLSATEFSLPLLQPSKSVSVVADTWSDAEVEKPEA